MYVLGYIQRDNRVYICDKDVSVTSFALSVSVIEYQTLVLRGDMDTAAELLETIPDDQKNKIARFLEGQNYKELALEVATDPEHKFDLALSLGQLNIALEIARQRDVEHKWKVVGDAALAAWDLALAEECFTHAKDLGSLLLLHSSTGNTAGLRELAQQAQDAGSNNIAFTCLWQLADFDGCVDILIKTNRTAEAVLFAQTYKPSTAPAIVAKWKQGLEKEGKGKVSRTIGMPPGGENADEDLFPEWEQYLTFERKGKTGTLVDVDMAEKSEANGNGT
jgi:coatomer subunit beta'